MADHHAQHLAPTVAVDADGINDGNRDEAVVSAGFDVSGIQPDMGSLAFDRPDQEGLNSLVDLTAEPGDLALADPPTPIALARSSAERVEMSWLQVFPKPQPSALSEPDGASTVPIRVPGRDRCSHFTGWADLHYARRDRRRISRWFPAPSAADRLPSA